MDRGTSDTSLDKGRAEGMVPAQRLVVLDLAAEVWAKEEETPEKDGTGNSERDTQNGADGQLGKTEARGALENDVEDVDEDGDGKVEGDGSKTPLERILMTKDKEFGD